MREHRRVPPQAACRSIRRGATGIAGAPRPIPTPAAAPARPEILVLLVVELVVQIVVFVELLLLELVVEVLVQVLVLFEVFELFLVETVAATLERPVRRVTGQHCHPQLRLWLMGRTSDPACVTTPRPPAARGRACAAPRRAGRACAAAPTTASPRSVRRPRCTRAPARASPGAAAPK